MLFWMHNGYAIKPNSKATKTLAQKFPLRVWDIEVIDLETFGLYVLHFEAAVLQILHVAV